MKKVIAFSVLLTAIFVFSNIKIMSQSNTAGETYKSHQALARDIFRELIEINTTRNNGSTRASEAMAARLISAGFPVQDVRIEGPRPENMNLVVRYRGKGKKAPVLFIGHLDVVEALRQDWSYDPFKLTEKDGYFYGRGTTDMKVEDADIIANLIRLKKENYLPERDIIVALTDHEEGGNYNGIKWLLANRRELIDAEFCINLDGGGGSLKNGKHVTMEIQTSEKIYFDIKFEVRNKGGHSARPVRDNAIYRLSEALLKVADNNFPFRINETTQMFFERSADNETGQVRTDMLAISKNISDNEAAERLAKSSPYYNSMLRTTCVATMLSGGHAENALPQTATANVNCRMHPDDNQEFVLATLRSVVNDSLVMISAKNKAAVSPASPLVKEVLDPLEKITASMWPGVKVVPVMSTGATDGLYLRSAGIPVYGTGGMFTDIDDSRAHGKDERIGVKEFYEGVDFMYRFIKALTSDK
jgi:acetylornithine deacetylase/succinyl-diaminopimelate desuccinylase-like protein